MITWLVELNCGACYSRLTVPVKAIMCPFEPDHLHVGSRASSAGGSPHTESPRPRAHRAGA